MKFRRLKLWKPIVNSTYAINLKMHATTYHSILQSGHAVISPPQAGPGQRARKDQSSQDDRKVGQGLHRSPRSHRHINGQDAHRPGGADPYGRTDQEGLRHSIICSQIKCQIVRKLVTKFSS